MPPLEYAMPHVPSKTALAVLLPWHRRSVLGRPTRGRQVIECGSTESARRTARQSRPTPVKTVGDVEARRSVAPRSNITQAASDSEYEPF